MPKELECSAGSGDRRPLHPLWNRRFSTKFNGVGYVTQRAAEALYSEEGCTEVAALIGHYMGNAEILVAAAKDCGLLTFGGANAPYIWVRGPGGLTSWEIFDAVLSKANVVVTPGSGFGPAGEGYFRISSFNSRSNVEEVAARLRSLAW